MSNQKGKRGITAGERMADALIEWCHLMYNVDTVKRVIGAVIKRLQERVKEFKREK